MKSLQLEKLRQKRDTARLVPITVPLFMSKRRFKRLAKKLLKNSYGRVEGIPLSAISIGDGLTLNFPSVGTLLEYFKENSTHSFSLVLNSRGVRVATSHFWCSPNAFDCKDIITGQVELHHLEPFVKKAKEGLYKHHIKEGCPKCESTEINSKTLICWGCDNILATNEEILDLARLERKKGKRSNRK